MLRPVALLCVATATLAYVAGIVAQHTIDVVTAERLLPRWDLATHLGHGWLDYHLLATGQVHRFLWDLWLQGYWPPMFSIFQVPFYLVLGGEMASGLWSGLIAFVLVGLTGAAVQRRQWDQGVILPASLYLALLMSSPYLLAYAPLTMTEMFGAWIQLLVLLAWVHYHRAPTPAAARLFAVSLTVLFFTKYNYFLLLVAPLVIHEWLGRTEGATIGQRLAGFGRWTGRQVSTPTGALLVLYLALLLIIHRTGGFEFRVLGQRVSIHSAGNSGYVVLYFVMARIWFKHRKGRIDWELLKSADLRVGPLLWWFVLPVTIWMASPYPNHIRDFTSLVFARPMGEPSVAAGLASYLDALRTVYFFNEWMLAAVVVAFGIAAVRYRRQAPFMQLLILAVPIQFVAITFHQTRFTRFLLLTMVLLCLTGATEVGRWFARSALGRQVAGVLAAVVLASGVLMARQVVTQERFRAIAFEHYTNGPALLAALDSVRAELTSGDRLAIVGQGDSISPALFRWELGPPSGVPCFPYELGGSRGIDLAYATRVLLVEPVGTGATAIDVTSDYQRRQREILEQLDAGALIVRREMVAPDMSVTLRLYDRVSTSAPKAPCR
jgi:hypothetical protein